MRFPLLFDDAAIFPPGNLPLAEAVVAHHRHRTSPYADLVGPLVVSAAAVPQVSGAGAVAVVLPGPDAVPAVLDHGVPGVRVVAVEVAVPEAVAVADLVPVLAAGLDRGTETEGLEVYVEVPRDGRGPAVVAALASSTYHAKLRTGGVRAELYPDETELAANVVALARAGVRFKATAGLHHALRNTDPETGFEQHGFLNLLVATAAAVGGAGADEVAALLAIRDPGALPPPTASLLTSIGTCSIEEPVAELTGLGLLALAGA